MNSIATKAVSSILRSSQGRICTVEFVKKNGELRKLNGRLGVHKNLTGGGLKFDPEKRGLLPIYDMQKLAYRMVNLNTVRRIATGGATIYVFRG